MSENRTIIALRAEMEECIGLLRPHFPKETDEQLRHRAAFLRERRYKSGRWPSQSELAAYAAQEAH